jgi:hypothetical protein
MATKEAQPDLSQVVRAKLIAMLRGSFLVASVVLLGYIVYLFVWSSDPRQDKNPQEIVALYTTFVRPFVGQGGGRPSKNAVDDWLSYFDSSSRTFFNENADGIAFLRYQFDKEGFKALGPTGRREKAMIIVLNRPPLNGIAGVTETRTLNDGSVALQVKGLGGETRVVLKKEGKVWRMTELGGTQTQLAQEVTGVKGMIPRD